MIVNRLISTRRCAKSYGVALVTCASRRCMSNNTRDTKNPTDATANVFDNILRNVQDGTLNINDAKDEIESKLKILTKGQGSSPNAILDSFANLDHTRANRTGFPEAIFGAGKTPQQIATILDDMAANVNNIVEREVHELGKIMSSDAHTAILATRVDAKLYEEIAKIPLHNGKIIYHELAQIISMEASSLSKNIEKDKKKKRGSIVVSCAGTTDLPVAEEAAITLEAAGCNVDRIYDVGVAGLHRIINALPRLKNDDVDCVIVCAGMDGALPSVVAGLVSVPVVAVPTSVGYGASFSGVSALLTMLNSCAPGVGVVNIDNGFGGAALAFKCLRQRRSNAT